MRQTHRLSIFSTGMVHTGAALLSLILGISLLAAQEKPAASAAQRAFETPQEAADALIGAARAFDTEALKQILGPGSEDLVSSQDPVQDKNRAETFAAMAGEKKLVEISPKDPKRAVLSVGKEQWPLPIPIVQRKGKWYFDSKEGREAILLRRIGANELDAITICRGYVEAQHEYALQVHDDSGINQYAQRIISTPGKQDGLVWKNSDGTLGGPIREDIAKAIEQGYTKRDAPYHGYYFKVLKGQGPAAPMGQLDFVVQGVMIGGFAMVAAPAEYRVTGVKTFIVSHDGVVYQKDLGPDTLKIAMEMERYNPDRTWTPTQDAWPTEAVATK